MIIRPEHFTHLHAHSHMSMRDGSIPVSTLVDQQVENGSRAVALTDHGTMTGAFPFYDHIHNVRGYKGVKHIIGLEAYISTTRDALNEFLPRQSDIEDKDVRAAERKRLAKKYHQILLAKDLTGYHNLVKIHNDGWMNGFYRTPTTTPEIIFQHAEGLIATTTCLASIWNQKILTGDIAGAEKEIHRWKEVFGDDFYIELQPINYDQQRLVNIELIRLARKTDTRMIVTNDVHYVEKEDHKFHYILLNLDKLGKQEGEQEKGKLWEFSVDDLYLKTVDQMREGWKANHKSKDFTESVFEETIFTISDIIDSIQHYSLESKPLLPKVSEVPSKEELQRRVLSGFKEKLRKGLIPKAQLAEYQERVIEELNVISLLDSEDYFLVCSEIANFCDENSIERGIARGSGGGSIVLWLLGVTGLDPIRYKLLFSRFLDVNRRVKLKM